MVILTKYLQINTLHEKYRPRTTECLYLTAPNNKNLNKDWQCTHNVTMNQVPPTMVVVEKQYVLHILCMCVSVALVIQHEMHMRPTVICDVSRSIIFFHIISQTVQFKKIFNIECVF